MWYRALSSLAFCAAAFAICVSAAILIALAIIDPSKEDDVKVSFLNRLSWLAHHGFAALIWSLVFLLGAVAIAPFQVEFSMEWNVPTKFVVAIVALTLCGFVYVFWHALYLFGIDGERAASCALVVLLLFSKTDVARLRAVWHCTVFSPYNQDVGLPNTSTDATAGAAGNAAPVLTVIGAPASCRAKCGFLYAAHAAANGHHGLAVNRG